MALNIKSIKHMQKQQCHYLITWESERQWVVKSLYLGQSIQGWHSYLVKGGYQKKLTFIPLPAGIRAYLLKTCFPFALLQVCAVLKQLTFISTAIHFQLHLCFMNQRFCLHVIKTKRKRKCVKDNEIKRWRKRANTVSLSSGARSCQSDLIIQHLVLEQTASGLLPLLHHSIPLTPSIPS